MSQPPRFPLLRQPRNGSRKTGASLFFIRTSNLICVGEPRDAVPFPSRARPFVTWHAAWFLILKALTLACAALLLVVAWVVAHRGRVIAESIGRLFPRGGRSWLRILLGIVIIAASLMWFASILRGVLTDGKVVAADHRLHNTLRYFRSEALHLAYSAITNLGGTIFIAPVALLLAMVFWMHRRKHEATIFVISLLGAEVLSVALKYIVRRPRPPDAARLVSGPSFPSGHTLAATAVYGILIFLLLREQPRRRWHIAAIAPLFALIALIPISRVYLGLHWPHDVTASVSLGCAWLACLTMLVRFRPDGSERDEKQNRLRPAVFAGLAAAVLLYAILLARFDVQPEARPSLPPLSLAPPAVLQAFPPGLHPTSEDLIGGPMEPLSFLFVGTADDLQRRFENAGWFLADMPSVRSLAYELWCVIRDRPDPHGPATPAYYSEQPQDFTFERPGTPSGSIRHRHHIRIWSTPLCIAPDCTPLWAATCSYDMGIEFVPKVYLLTHRIDPNVDHEREFVAGTLQSAGAIDLRVIPVTGPRRGSNAGGDAFVTDGRAHVILLSQKRGGE